MFIKSLFVRSICTSRYAFILALSAGFLLAGCRDDNKTAVLPERPTVGVVTQKDAPLQITTELPGRTEAFRVAEVRPQVGGIILKRHFVEGSNITAGASLYQIDPAPYHASYDSAAADLAQAKAAAHIAQLTANRDRSLWAKKYISQQQLDSAVADMRQANATVTAAQAALELARINLAYTKVIAPISGRIGGSRVTEGALVTPDQSQALAVIQQLDPIYVDVTQSSNDFLRLKQELASGSLAQTDGKASVTLLLANGKTYPLTGTLEFSDVTVDESTGSLTLRAVFPNPHGDLLPGMFVRARLDEGVRPHALLVPQQGLTRNARGEATVLVVGVDDRVENKIVNAAQAIGSHWLGTGGLSAGDRVSVSGLQRIRPGMQVVAQEAHLSDTWGESHQ